jgi:hypothetical protein
MEASKPQKVNRDSLPDDIQIDATDDSLIITRANRIRPALIAVVLGGASLIMFFAALPVSAMLAITALVFLVASVVAALYDGLWETITLEDGYLRRKRENLLTRLLQYLNMDAAMSLLAEPDVEQWAPGRIQDVQHGKEMADRSNKRIYSSLEDHYAVHAVVPGDGIQQLMAGFSKEEEARSLARLIASRMFQPEIDTNRLDDAAQTNDEHIVGDSERNRTRSDRL